MAISPLVSIQDEGLLLPPRQLINFAGSNVTASDSGGTTLVTAIPRPGSSWMPSASIENFPRTTRIDAQSALASGRLSLFGGLVIPAGRAINSITFVSSTTAAGTPTNQWFCLVDQALNVLMKTADDTTTAWLASATKTLTLSAPYTPAAEISVFAGIMVAATTVPTLAGVSAMAAMNAIAPQINIVSTASLTNPASLGATASSGAAGGQLPYCYIT